MKKYKNADEVIYEFFQSDFIRADIVVDTILEKLQSNSKRRLIAKLPNILNRCGFVKYLNPDRFDGRWRINNNNYSIYSKNGIEMVNKNGNENRSNSLPDYLKI